MVYQHIRKKLLWIGLFIGLCGFLHPGHAGAAAGIIIDPDQMEIVEINATIMEVNVKKSYLVVAEKKFFITEFKIGKKTYKAALVDAGGNVAALGAFKKGQRVIVKGIRLPKGDYVAGSVQKKSAGYKELINQRFIPKARSMTPAR